MHLDLQVILLTKEMVSGRRWMSDQEQEVGFLVEVINMYEKGQDKGATVSVYMHDNGPKHTANKNIPR